MTEQVIPVLIAGGGPVGLTLGHVLASYGVRVMIIERNPDTTRHPKMDLTNARSMEIYRRIGVADLLRAAAVPEQYGLDIVCTTGLGPSARELLRFSYRSPVQAREHARSHNDGAQPAEPPMRISQAVLEPVLKQALEQRPGVQVRYGWALESCRDLGDHVVATICRGADGAREDVVCRYLAGCDGAGSTARKDVGIELEGDAGLRPSYLVHFRSHRLEVLQRWGRAWHTRHGSFSLVAQDDRETWTLQYRLAPDGSGVPADPRDLLRQLFGSDLDAEILVANTWRANLLVARKYRSGRILLAGDSVHQVVPTGGYGMNTGVGDAMGLGWQLAAVLQGWGGDALLDAYEAERRPVALANREASRRHVEARLRMREAWESEHDLEEDSPAGEARRAAVADRLRAIGNLENESHGVEYGYRYEASPVILYEPGNGPVFDPVVVSPSTLPGARLPSTYLPDGRLLYERLGPGFTLIAFGTVDDGGFEVAARTAGVLANLVRLNGAATGLQPIYERPLLLVRPDQHVAWRGDSAPEWAHVLAIACGRVAQPKEVAAIAEEQAE